MIEFRNITVKFKNTMLFDNFSMSLDEGEKVLLFGKSGTGKSTFLKLVLGFIRPITGEILINNEKFDRKKVWQLRKTTAYVNQNLEIGEGNIREYLAEFLSLKSNVNVEFSEQEIAKLIEFFELPTDLLEKNIEDISGGEKQRFAIIMSILLNRDIYLLDEITSGLDAEMKQKVVDFFAIEFNKTLLIVSHDEIWREFPNIRVITLNGAKK